MSMTDRRAAVASRPTGGSEACGRARAVGAAILIAASVAGIARADEVWRAGTHYTFAESVFVETSLTIEAGVSASFASGARLIVNPGATLTVLGEEGDRVWFGPASAGESWGGIAFDANSFGSIQHADIVGAGSVTVFVIASSPILEGCRIGYSTGTPDDLIRYGVFVVTEGAHPVLRGCTIEALGGFSRSPAADGVAGTNGAHGANGTVFSPDGGNGQAGGSGGPGANGLAGGQAFGVIVQDGATAVIERCTIRWITGGDGADGGDGGKGGNGGNGGDAFNGGFTPDGGDGAPAGAAGPGGNGGFGGAALGILVADTAGEVVMFGNAISAVQGGRGGRGGAGGAGGVGGAGGDGGDAAFTGGAGGDGAAGTDGASGGLAGSAGITRAIGVQFPTAELDALVVQNTLATILRATPAAGGTGGVGGAGGTAGAGGEGNFGDDGLPGSPGAAGTSGSSAPMGTATVAIGVSAAGENLHMTIHNHVADLDPDGGLSPDETAQFRAFLGATCLVTHACVRGHATLVIGDVTIGAEVLEADPLLVQPPFVVPPANGCCSVTGIVHACQDIDCLTAVCGTDQECCLTAWDEVCVSYALEQCVTLCAAVAGVDLRVDAASPVIDRGDNTEVPASLVTDLAGDPRITDGDGNGSSIVDLGAFESIALACGPDLTCDGMVDGADIATMLGAWGPCGASCAADLDGSGAVDAADLALLLGAWR